ncbi:MAG TPA: sigma-54 dependent transcriptional regulator [Bryobacteraceae bacterium]|nr:sigma-54 dependent transcriptional regulator [Bryobacteraceae bacterium]
MTNEITIVLADTDTLRRKVVRQNFSNSVAIHEAETFTSLLRFVLLQKPHVVVLGTFEGNSTQVIEAAHQIRNVSPLTKVILIAECSTEAFAIGALRAGVCEYLKAPVDSLELTEAVRRHLPANEPTDEFRELVGASEAMREVKDFIRKVSPLDSTVMITGESGTGKEIVARLIHQNSLRKQCSFVTVNCAAIPDSLVESELFGYERGAFTGAISRQAGQMRLADRGTLFLDEIGDMSALAQSKMLRALEQREIQPLGATKTVPIDIRLITATHRDLDKLVAEEKFRSDLYYRIDVSRIHLPSLRERQSDIPVLAAHFIGEMNRLYGRQIEGLTPEALQTLVQHDWPGNVRQLRNVIEAAAVVCTTDRISDRDLRTLRSVAAEGPPQIKISAAVIPTRKARQGKDVLLEALETTNWNVTRTAELLRWSRSTLYRQIARHQLKRSEESIVPDGETTDQEKLSEPVKGQATSA